MPGRILMRYILLLITGTLAGFLSSIYAMQVDPVLGLRGLLLGFFLSLGIIFINEFGKIELLSNRPPTMKNVLVSATCAGILGGLVIYGVAQDIPRYFTDDFPTPVSCFHTVATACCYSIAMHTAYSLRWRIVSFRKIKIFVLICLAGHIASLSRMFSNFSLDFVLLLACFSGYPFAFFWAAAVMSCDPAWSHERLNKQLSD